MSREISRAAYELLEVKKMITAMPSRNKGCEVPKLNVSRENHSCLPFLVSPLYFQKRAKEKVRYVMVDDIKRIQKKNLKEQSKKVLKIDLKSDNESAFCTELPHGEFIGEFSRHKPIVINTDVLHESIKISELQ